MCSAQVKLPVRSGGHPGQPRRQPHVGIFRADDWLPTGCHWEEQNRNQSSLETAWTRLSTGRESSPERSPSRGQGRAAPSQDAQLRGPSASQGAQQPDSSCRARSATREKVLAQRLHWYFLVSECVCRWARRLERSAKALLQ